jgi:hypothetical protein
LVGAATVPFTPAVLSSVNAWYDANDSSTITGSAPVTVWNDKSGNQHTATRTAGTLTLCW